MKVKEVRCLPSTSEMSEMQSLGPGTPNQYLKQGSVKSLWANLGTPCETERQPARGSHQPCNVALISGPLWTC